MSIPRLFIDAPLAEDTEADSLPGQGRYLGSVLRRGVGDAVLLFNGRDGEFEASIAALRKDSARFVLRRRLRPQPPPAGPILLIALLKRDAMEWPVEKATELGVAAIRPVLTTRCVADKVNRDRLGLIAREAAEQCERLDVPEIADPLPLHTALDLWARQDPVAPLFLGAERGAAPPLAETLRQASPASGPGWLVGPEGGFAPAELDAVRRRPFVVPVALGPRILRAETAAISGLAVLQSLCGDWAEGRN